MTIATVQFCDSYLCKYYFDTYHPRCCRLSTPPYGNGSPQRQGPPPVGQCTVKPRKTNAQEQLEEHDKDLLTLTWPSNFHDPKQTSGRFVGTTLIHRGPTPKPSGPNESAVPVHNRKPPEVPCPCP